MKKESAGGGKKAPPVHAETGAVSKSEATRRKVIAAARRVFTRHPYHAASIRMIGEEGGFDYSIVHHYFTKAELFRAVCEQLYGELITVYPEWIDGLERLRPEEGLKIYLDRAMDYQFANPDVLELLIQNTGYMKINPDLPGFEFFTRFFREIEAIFLEKNQLLTRREEVSMWSYTMLTLQTAFVGAAAYHGKALGKDPQSKAYRNWVKKTLLYIFVPPLEKLIQQAIEKRRSS